MAARTRGKAGKASSRSSSRKPRRRAPARAVVVERPAGRVLITPVDAGDTSRIAGALLDAAGDTPGVVRTTTGPAGWTCPAGVARAAGFTT